jgi:lipid-A-disaccharide synthase
MNDVPASASDTPVPPCILFTAFEPSGDEHAAPVIEELRRLLPDTPIHAFGGPRMAEAGAQLIEQTCARGTMGASSLGEIGRQMKLRRRLRAWLDDHRVAVHVATDSPAANWAFCKIVRRRWGKPADGRRSKTVHLVAPQVWAWATWRVGKLRRHSDLVLCLLPFEPAWFAKQGVGARFVGHPVFDDPLDEDAMNWDGMHLPGGHPRIALLPGSRPGEIKSNWPDMVEVMRRLTANHKDAQAAVVAVHQRAAERLREYAPDWPDNIKLVQGHLNPVLHWADVVLAASGTVTLHVARHCKPMAIVYRINRLSWSLVGRWVVNARTFALPNLIAANRVDPDPADHVVREFIPFWGDVQPVVDEMHSLITNEDKRAAQVAELRKIAGRFEHRNAGREAAEAIVQLMRES